jgi:hypothetical protein
MPPGWAISTQLGQNFTTRVRNNRGNFRFVVHARLDLAALHQGNGLQMRLMAWMPGDLPQDAELRKEIRIHQAMNLVRQLPTPFSVNLARAAFTVIAFWPSNERSGAALRTSRTRTQVRQNSATTVRHDGAKFICRVHARRRVKCSSVGEELRVCCPNRLPCPDRIIRPALHSPLCGRANTRRP